MRIVHSSIGENYSVCGSKSKGSFLKDFPLIVEIFVKDGLYTLSQFQNAISSQLKVWANDAGKKCFSFTLKRYSNNLFF